MAGREHGRELYIFFKALRKELEIHQRNTASLEAGGITLIEFLTLFEALKIYFKVYKLIFTPPL